MATKNTTKKQETKKPVKQNSLVERYRGHKQDTGSAEVQVALLSERIASLAKHLRAHGKDNDSRRGLLMMVGKRRRLLNYLKQNDAKTYEKLIIDLKLRK